ncbi:MAG: hypothetical protein AAFW89_12370 [Bacteroidota bacterium]
MKKVISLALLTAFLSLGVTAQVEYEIKNENHKKEVVQLTPHIYRVTFTNADGEIVQTGQYFERNQKMLPHGVWKLFAPETGHVLTKAKYKKGKQLWVETIIDGKLVKVYNEFIASIDR